MPNVTQGTIQKTEGSWAHISGYADVDIINDEQTVVLEIDLEYADHISEDDNPCVSVFPINIVSASDLSFKAMFARGESTIADGQLQIVARVKASGDPGNVVVSVGYTAAIPLKKPL